MAKLKASTLIETVAALSLLAFILASSIYLFTGIVVSDKGWLRYKANAKINYKIQELKNKTIPEDPHAITAVISDEDGISLEVRKSAYNENDNLTLIVIKAIKDESVIAEQHIIVPND